METQELSAPSILALFETTKAERQSFVADVVSRLKEGEIEPLLTHYQVKCMSEVIASLTSDPDYKEMLLVEAQKQGKSFEFMNSKIEVKEAGTKYDYSVCQDETYNDLSQQMEALKAKMKDREKMLQTIPENGLADPNTGNMIYRASKSSSTTVAVTLL